MRETFQRRDVRHITGTEQSVTQLLLAVTEIQRQFIGEQDPPRQFGEALNQLLTLSGSKYGFIGEVRRDADGTPWLGTHAISDVAWDAPTRQKFQQNVQSGLQLRELDNLFGEVVQTEEPVIVNSPGATGSRNIPSEAHPELTSFLGIPFHFGGMLVGMVGLANREDGYCDDLVAWLEPLTTTCAAMIAAVRSDRQRQAAERSLRDSEEHFRLIADLTAEVTFVAEVDASGQPQLISIGGNLSQVLGQSAEQLFGTQWQRLVHADDAPLIEAMIETARTGEATQQVIRWHHPQSGIRSLQVSARRSSVSENADDGSTFRIDGCIVDITAALKSEQTLREALDRYQAILHTVPDLLFLTTRDGVFLDFWSGDESALIAAPDQFIGKRHRDILPPAVCEQWDEAIRQVVATGEVQAFEYSLPVDGATLHFEARVVSGGDQRESILTVSRNITERLNAEAAETRHFALLKEISRNTRELIFVKDTQRRFLFVNDATAGVIGREIEDILGRTNDELLSEATARMTAESDRQVLETGTSLICEQTIPTADGQRFFLTSKAPWRNESGELLGLIGIAQDVTELRQTNRELERSRQFAERIAEASPHIMYVFDIVEQRNLYSNRQIADDLGYSPDEICDMGSDFFARTLHPDDLARVPEMLARWETAQDGDILEQEYRMRTASGEWRWFLGRDTVFRRDSNGRVRQIIGTAQDISDRYKAQQALQESEARLRAIIESEPECVKLVARDGTLLEINSAGLRFAGADSLDDVIGRSAFDLIAPEYRQQFLDFHEMVCLGQAGTLEMEIIGLKGQRRRMETHAVPLKYGPDGEVGHLAVTLDVTDVRKAEELIAQQHAQLLHVSRLSSLGQMAGTISHEITQPLSAISNYAATCRLLLQRERPDLATFARHVESIAKQAHRAGETLDRIRSFISGNDSRKERCHIEDVISGAIALMKAELRNRQTHVAIHAPVGLPAVTADCVQIQQVITNLVTNSCDAMQDLDSQSRQIDIDCRPSGEFVTVTIQDSGPGLDDVSQDKLFEPFCTSKSDGMGLGLAICRDIVTAHGGMISAANSPAGGAVFQFTLPVSQETIND